MSTRKPLLALVMPTLALSCAVLVLASGTATAQPVPTAAPLSPAFVRTVQQQVPQSVADAPGTHAKGHVPSPLDLSHLALQRPLVSHSRQSAAAHFDLRTLGHLTAVRNQGTCGACWSFASLASLESSLMPSETWDFSENNLKNRHGFAWDACSGGNRDMAVAYLARWNGPVRESDDAYVPAVGTSPALSPVKLVEDVLYLGDRTSPSDNEKIKTALTTYNTAVYTAMMMDEAYYNSTNHSYFYRGAATQPQANHAVAIVGWDDDYSATQFSPPAPGNGAFIVRNSWSSGWGDAGYFYASYYDMLIGQESTVFLTPAQTSKYQLIHAYDPLGCTGSMGYGSTVGWAANLFSTSGDEKLLAVGFYALSDNTAYEIYLYSGATPGNPRSGTLLTTAPVSGTLAWAGYHTIALPTPPVVAGGQRFSVVVKLTTPGYTYPIPTESAVPDYSPAAQANSGESFVSSDGWGWTDAQQWQPTTNVAIKVLAEPGCSGGCLVDGTCVSAGTVNPNNPCALCDPVAAARDWTAVTDGTSCDDGLFCNGVETCRGGTCAHEDPPVCDDGLSCTSDYCVEATPHCKFDLNTGACLIGGACFADGDLDPANPCRECNAFALPDGWTNDDSNRCSDGDLCTTGDACSAGVCKGVAKECPTPTAACRDVATCDPTSGECVDQLAADGTACDDGDRCTEFDRCQAGVCQGLEVICKVDECWVGRCDPSLPTGCAKDMAPDGTACNGGTCRAGQCQREDALRSYACGTPGAPAPLLVLAFAALAMAFRRRAAANR